MAPCRGNVAGVWTPRPQATCTGSIPSSSCYVPSRSHCWASLPAVGGAGGRGGAPGTGPAWLVSHPCFVHSLECPGTRSSAPWGDTGAIPLISSLDRFLFIPAWDSAGSQPQPLPVPVRLCLSQRWQPGAVQLGAGGLPGGGLLLAHLRRGPEHASKPTLRKHFSSCFSSQTPFFAGDPLILRSRSLLGMMFSGPKGLGRGQNVPTILISVPFSGADGAQSRPR